MLDMARTQLQFPMWQGSNYLSNTHSLPEIRKSQNLNPSTPPEDVCQEAPKLLHKNPAKSLRSTSSKVLTCASKATKSHIIQSTSELFFLTV